MEINIKSKYLKTSPYKVRPLLNGLRDLKVEDAFFKLNFMNQKGAKMVLSVLNSAIAVVKENDLEKDNFYVKAISCNEGPRLKRRQIRARGRATQILKRMSHINLVIADKSEIIKETNDKNIAKSTNKNGENKPANK